ncbi:MAG: hypothetical protein KatS3mg023_0588 [Armatimonadota bacterium]|nr:MAG: hypothetical protein KatS3mg023_0588 [Armatimonadota bacterium]
MARYAHYDRDYRELQFRAGIGRLQVAVNDVGEITEVSITPTAPVSPDARPHIADVVLSPSLAVKGDGRWIGWEWFCDTGTDYVVTYKRDGVQQQINVSALPAPPDGIGSAESVFSPLHTGVFIERRRVRLEGAYPSGGFHLQDVDDESTALVSAMCDDYYVGFIQERLRLYNKSNYNEVSAGQNISTDVLLLFVHHQL